MSRLFIRVETISGPRTIVSHELTPRDASEISQTLASAGFDTAVSDDIAPVSLDAIIRRKRRADASAARKASAPSNLIKMPAKRRP